MTVSPTRLEPKTELLVAAAVICKGDRYLVGQRPTYKHHGDLWEFPGGKVEQLETPTAALERELQEELDVQLTEASFLHEIHITCAPSLRISFYQCSITGEPKLLEHQELSWYTLEELFEQPLAPADRAFLVNYLTQPLSTR